MENNSIYSDMTDLVCGIRAINASMHILHEYAANTEPSDTKRVDNIIMSISGMVELMDKIELAADAVETRAYQSLQK